MWFPIWLHVCVVSLAVVSAVVVARRLIRRAPGVALDAAHRHLRGVGLGIAALVVLAIASGLAMARTDLEWRLGLGVSRAVPLVFWACVVGTSSFAFGLVSAVALMTSDRRRWALLATSLLLVWVVQLGVRHWTRPVWEELTNRVDFEGVVLQTSAVSCGAASAANVARALGQARTEAEMARLIGTTNAGSSAAQLATGLLAVGVACVPVEATKRSDVGAPSLLFVDHPQGGPESHAVSVIEREGRLEVWDPLYGRSNPTDEELRAIWRGRALRCRM